MPSLSEILANPGFKQLPVTEQARVREFLRQRVTTDAGFAELPYEEKTKVLSTIYPRGTRAAGGTIEESPGLLARMAEPFRGGILQKVFAPLTAIGELVATGAEQVGVRRPVAPPEALESLGSPQPLPLLSPMNLIMMALPFTAALKAAQLPALVRTLPFFPAAVGGADPDIEREAAVLAAPEVLGRIPSVLRRVLGRHRATLTPPAPAAEPSYQDFETLQPSSQTRRQLPGQVGFPRGLPAAPGADLTSPVEWRRLPPSKPQRALSGMPERRALPPFEGTPLEELITPGGRRQFAPVAEGPVESPGGVLVPPEAAEWAPTRFEPTREPPPALTPEQLAEEEAALRKFLSVPPGQPRFEPTPAGEQGLIPGLPRREIPPTQLRPEGAQADIRETPLFGQERAARERAAQEGQGNISGTTAHGFIPPVPLPSPPEEERDTPKGRLQQVAQVAGLALPAFGMLFGRGRGMKPGTPRVPSNRPPEVLPQYRQERVSEPALRQSASTNKPIPTEPGVAVEPPLMGRPPSSGPPRPPVPPSDTPWTPSRWRRPDPEAVNAWKIVQRAEGTMHWGRWYGAFVGRQLRDLVPPEHHRAVSEFLDTGRTGTMTGVPPNVAKGAAYYRDQMDKYLAFAQASGQLGEDQFIEHYFTHLLVGPERAVEEVGRRLAAARKTSPFFKERTIPTLAQVEGWLRESGLERTGVRVSRDPAHVANAYIGAYHRAEAMREMATDLATSVTRDRGPVLMGADAKGPGTIIPEGYTAVEHPLLRWTTGGQLPLVDSRYVPALKSLLDPGLSPIRFLRALDTVNNIHRGIVMALPWKHGFFNVGMDSLALTGLWKGLVHGEWLGIRREGAQMLKEADPFVEKLIRQGEVRVPTLANPLEEVRRSLSEMMRNARIPGTNRPVPGMAHMGKYWEQLERVTWEKMVGGWAVGLSKLLMERANEGIMPKSLLNAGVTREGWQALSEADRFKAVGRVINLVTGQLPRTLFESPNFVQGLRHVMFSPSWNLSNLGMAEAAMRAEGSFALRGLSPAQGRVVSGYMQEYAARSITQHYVLSAVFHAATTSALTGSAWYLWQNPPGYRTRIYSGTDAEGRSRFAMSPFGYLVKDLENVIHAGFRGGQLRIDAAQDLARSKLAIVPKLAATAGAGFIDPYMPRTDKLGGTNLSDRLIGAVENAANTVVPLRSFGRDPVGGVMGELGVATRHAPSAMALQGRMKNADREFAIEIKLAQTRGDLREANNLIRRREQVREDMQAQLQSEVEFERLREGKRP